MPLPVPIPIDDIRSASKNLAGLITRTPLLRFYGGRPDLSIYLKCENLQPIGSFKLRGAGNALTIADPHTLQEGVYTASAGNMAQGVAWVARQAGIRCQVIVPDHAPQTKLDAICRLGATYTKLPFDEWWQVLVNRGTQDMSGLFIHPVNDKNVIAGNGTIGLEIAEDLPEVDAVIVPYGGGGLSSGIASALQAIKPDVQIYASEVDTAAPLAASLAAGKPVRVNYEASFVDGIGSGGLLPEMWPIASQLVPRSIVVSVAQIAEAVRLLMERNRLVAEGAGASSLAACLADSNLKGNVVCVLSGGNIDAQKLATILRGSVP